MNKELGGAALGTAAKAGRCLVFTLYSSEAPLPQEQLHQLLLGAKRKQHHRVLLLQPLHPGDITCASPPDVTFSAPSSALTELHVCPLLTRFYLYVMTYESCLQVQTTLCLLRLLCF